MRIMIALSFMTACSVAFKSVSPMQRLNLSVLANARKSKGISGDAPRRALVPEYKANNHIQTEYIKHMNDVDTNMVVAHGPAGTGKTLFACLHAVKSLVAGDAKRLVLTRPAVAVEGEELGFLPGDLVAKMSPFTQPLFDILHEFYSKTEVKLMLSNGIIEVSPLAFMRGRTFKDAIIIADEMQNSTPNQMLMLATRIGNKSKLIITGDLDQSDRLLDNGLADLLVKLNGRCMRTTKIQVSDMTGSPILRSEVVAEIIDIYGKK